MSPHPSVDARLARLAPDQRAAATAPPGPVLCIAPAGSGKTTTLVARIAWLVASGAAPGTITAVTFNRRAAEELGERLGDALAPLGLPASAVRVRTFHALGREILAEAGADVGRLVDRNELLRELEGDRATPAWLRRLDDAFSRLKLDVGVDPDAVAEAVRREEQAGRPPGPVVLTFLRYQAALRELGALEFDDLVPGASAALERDPELLERWRHRSAHLLVDEVQDLDRSQLRLALLLAAPADDIFLVGDDDQTIYAWRLADVRRVLGLAGDLPRLRRADLVTNYRCPPAVVRRAVRLVEHNAERFAKRIEPGPDAGGDLFLAPDPGDDVARARHLVASWPAAPGGTHAVLARTNGELTPFAAAALEASVPYRASEDGLVIDDPALEVLLRRAGGLEEQRPELPLLVVLEQVRRGASRDEAAAAEALLAWAPASRDVSALRDAVLTARRRRADLTTAPSAIVLSTVHATKGLEFDHVACVGLDEGRFPSARSVAEASDPERALEEERRLAYVAWTRARRALVLLYDPAVPSPFLLEAFDADELTGSGRGAEG